MTPARACPNLHALERLALGQLPEPEAEQLGLHVLNCSSCADRLNTYQAADPLVALLHEAGPRQLLTDHPTTEALIERLVRAAPAPANEMLAPLGAGATPPKRVGRYQVIGRLGAGGMGVVWRAHDPQLGREVAIKIPNLAYAEGMGGTAAQRFLREARAAAAVRHAHVCPIHDVGEDQGRPFVVMALVEGESLRERLRSEGRFEDPSAAVVLLGAVAKALAAVHAAHIIHRDVKPANILLDRAGQPFLTDFGLAHADDGEHLTSSGALVGTPAYMAPEQAVPELGPVGPWSDQFSLAVVLYQMLTGRLPFAGSVSALIFQLGTQAVPRPSQFRPNLDPALEAICLKALARKPAERFDSMQAFANALEPFSQGPGRSVAWGDLVPRPEFPSAGTQTHSSPPPRGETVSGLYLAARYYLEKRTEEGLRKSIATYRQILDKDPTLPEAWAALGFAYHMLSVWGHAAPTNACPKAKSAALRALELDDSLGEAHMTLAAVLMEYDWDLPAAERAFRHALDLKPDHAFAHQIYGKCLACLGRHVEAIAAFRRAQDLDPLSPTISVALGRHGFLLARRYPEAIEQFQKTIETDSGFWLAHRFLGWAYVLQGNVTEAINAFETAKQLENNAATVEGLGYAYAVSGQREKAHETLTALAELGRRSYVSPDRQVVVYIGLGDRDQAFSGLAKALADRSEWLCKIRVDPVLDPLRSDPRFDALIKRMNIYS